MKPICVIPIRSGSKGLPDKNMLFLDGKPLVYHTIDAAIESGLFEKKDIVVTTDSKLYRDICLKRGISAVLRDEVFASDTATTFDLMEDFLKKYEDNQVFVLLQATSPFRTGQEIKEAYEIYKSEDVENVVSFTEVEKHPKLFTTLTEDNLIQDIVGIDKGYRRQNSDKNYYYPNGAIFISKKENYLGNRSLFTEKTRAYIMKKETSVDIDDEKDFNSALASIYYANRFLPSNTCRKLYTEKVELSTNENIILGDSRLENVHFENYDNYSIGGITLNKVLKNMDIILKNNPERVLIGLGINDCAARYSFEDIKEDFIKLFTTLKEHNTKIYMTTIIYSMFRVRINNKLVKQLNEWLLDYCEEQNIPILDLNEFLSEDGRLKFEYTYDGLHFTKEANKILQEKCRGVLAL